MRKLWELLGDFESLDSFEKASFVLGSELWEGYLALCLNLFRITYSIDVWELRKLGFIMTNISALHSPSVRIHLGNWGMLGMVLG